MLTLSENTNKLFFLKTNTINHRHSSAFLWPISKFNIRLFDFNYYVIQKNYFHVKYAFVVSEQFTGVKNRLFFMQPSKFNFEHELFPFKKLTSTQVNKKIVLRTLHGILNKNLLIMI